LPEDSTVHELSVCQALLTQVAASARQHGAEAVERITIEIGALSGVEPLLLLDAFSVMRSGSVASGAELMIETIGVSVSCLTCGARTETQANRLVCAACGGFRTRVISGDELRLRRIEMRVPGL
jgi:hydrogenase nickel incorporation protein HypA/HybF